MLGRDNFLSGETVSQLAERLQTNRKQLRQRFAEIEQSDAAGEGEQPEGQEKRYRVLRGSKYA